jgi:hypothetical protein
VIPELANLKHVFVKAAARLNKRAEKGYQFARLLNPIANNSRRDSVRGAQSSASPEIHPALSD